VGGNKITVKENKITAKELRRKERKKERKKKKYLTSLRLSGKEQTNE